MKKTVLITAAPSGIGKATARFFTGNGLTVVATMRDPAREIQVIYGAATDCISRLRYLVRDDSHRFLRAGREMSDQGYLDFMRSRFPSPEVAR